MTSGGRAAKSCGGKCKSTILLWVCLMALVSCADKPEPGHVLDEAQRANRAADTFPAADEDYFAGMDGDAKLTPKLTPDEVKGRNTWLVWTGGDDRLWDKMPNATFGAFDLLKTISSYPGAEYSRDNRWKYFGVVNEPCFSKATAPDPDRFGLWLDKRSADCPPDPFANDQKYPGVAIGSRGKNLPVGSYYGYPTGIVGLRLFPNPDFDEAAAKKWDARKYYTDPTYYEDKKLVRPYRVGMSCGFCHIGPSPINPPADPENPKWENLSSTVGSQYFWVDRVFIWNLEQKNFVYQWLHTARPGTLDTSLISSDNINNPRTMNAIYNLGDRLQLGKRWGKETLVGGGLKNKQFNDYFKDGPLTEFFQAPATVLAPRVLKDGSDSVGALGALNRVYINIGLFSEEWLLHFNPVVGGKPITPIEIAVAEKNSSYWRATEAQTPAMALFLVKAGRPDRLKDAPGGEAYLTKDKAELNRGKVVFAERCARCHSSKIPTPALRVDPGGCSGAGYLDCWNRYWDWTKTDKFKQKMKDIVLADDFLDGNFLSTELRVPVTLLKTNACSPLATNAIGGNIWDNFSSQTYKDLPSVGTITYYHPVTGEERQYQMPAGGRGYTRPASLVSLWSTAPFLLNNSVGRVDPSRADAPGYSEKWEPNPNPTVELRMKSFQNSIEQMLWPEKRDKDELLGDKIPGRIDRTSQQSVLKVSTGYLPDSLQGLVGLGNRFLPWLFGPGGIEIGPIPKGTPVNLLMNLNLLPDGTDLKERVKLLLKLKEDLKALPESASDEDAKKVFANVVDPLLALSKCPDFIVNRGHYFGTSQLKEEPGLSDTDKRALIELLKTF
jgi:hypothetical protein